MSESLRYRALAALRARLAYITIAHGYYTDAGLYIFMGEAPNYGSDEDPPAALVLAAGADNVTQQGARVVSEFTVEVQACVPVDLAEPLLAIERIIADIKAAVEIEGRNPTPPEGDPSVDRSLDGICAPRGFRRGSTRPIAREVGSTYGGAVVEYVLTIAEKWGEPDQSGLPGVP